MSLMSTTETTVTVNAETVTVATGKGMTYAFAIGNGLKLETVTVDYAWAFPTMSAEERAKHVRTYAAKDCPVVLEGVRAARSAARAAVKSDRWGT